jgi:hypothetical protein
MTTATRRRVDPERERRTKESRERTYESSDVGKIPAPRNPRRRKACRLDLYRFLTTYFPHSTGLSPFSEDHRRVIARIEHCILYGGRFVNAVYRGFAKSSIAERAALWATLYGHRRFVAIFGSDEGAAGGNIEAIKSELEDNDLLLGDFPRACYPIHKLEGRVQRALSQHHNGARTHVVWRADLLALPWISKSEAAGAVICARGITGGFRGMKHHRPDGVQQRPDLILLDDAQTDEAAGSALQVAKTLSLLRKAVVKLGGHRKGLAIVMNATVIQEGDVVDELLADPAWQGERIPLVRKWPDAHKTLWLEDYAKLRRTYDKDDVKDQERAHKAATAFYAARREEMDAGAEVSWENCYDPETELSALQHAYNALIDDGEEAFASEFQQRPNPRTPPRPGDLKPDAVAARVNRCPRGPVPPGCTRLTGFVDVQKDLLYYAVCAWSEGFGGAVIDYGAWPDQRRGYWALADANPTIARVTGIDELQGSLYAALTALSAQLLGREWPVHDAGGSALRVERCLLDSGRPGLGAAAAAGRPRAVVAVRR